MNVRLTYKSFGDKEDIKLHFTNSSFGDSLFLVDAIAVSTNISV